MIDIDIGLTPFTIQIAVACFSHTDTTIKYLDTDGFGSKNFVNFLWLGSGQPSMV